MQRKAEQISARLCETVSQWDGVEAVVLGASSRVETYDPYFAVDLDVYFRGSLPPSNDRRELFENPGGFETSPVYPIDRFLVDGLPASVHYKEVSRINLLIKRVQDCSWVFRSESTNLLYRIENGEILYCKGDWFESLSGKLADIPDGFWSALMDAARFTLDHYLNGIGAAVYRNDDLYYQFSASGFCQSLCSYVFALNKRFEPTGRMLHDRIKELDTLPAEFLGRFETFIRPDAELPPERKYEIAKLLAKSIGSA
jgi:hypothetical protein